MRSSPWSESDEFEKAASEAGRTPENLRGRLAALLEGSIPSVTVPDVGQFGAQPQLRVAGRDPSLAIVLVSPDAGAPAN